MSKIMECVPNISEGRNTEVIEAIADGIRASANVTLLDISSDRNHNRSVLTFIGEPDAVAAAAVRLAGKACELIDLTRHTGEHPRMGAVDVIPFIPIREMGMEECIALSQKTAAEITNQFGLPVFLYENSATSPLRANLADIRRGQFEGMAEKVQREGWEPDFGGKKIHPTAGVVAVGARMPLIAFNINLSTANVEIAHSIARIIRRSSGGFDCVKAIGIMLSDRNTAQVSINMTDYTRTPLYRVVEAVKTEARCYGVSVIGTEIVGLTPVNALLDSAGYYLQIENFSAQKQVLENYL